MNGNICRSPEETYSLGLAEHSLIPDLSSGMAPNATLNQHEADISGVCEYSSFPQDHTGMMHYGHQQLPPRKTYDHVKDKELRKKLKNRESAQAARDRKKAKMVFLEGRVSELLERNGYLEVENENLRKWIMNTKSSFGLTKQKEDEMGGYQAHYPGNAVHGDSIGNPVASDRVFALPFNHHENMSDAEAYPPNPHRNQLAGNVHVETFQTQTTYGQGYFPIEYDGSGSYIPHRYSVNASGLTKVKILEQEQNERSFTPAHGIAGLQVRDDEWAMVDLRGDSSQLVCNNTMDVNTSIHEETPEHALLGHIKEKSIFTSSEWDVSDRETTSSLQRRAMTYQGSPYSETDSSTKSISSDNGISGQFLSPQTTMNMQKNYSDDNFMLEVH